MYFTYIFPWSVLINGNYLGQNRKSGNVILIVNTPIKKVVGGGVVENFKFVEMVVHVYVYVWLYGKYCLVFLNWKYIRNIHFMGENHVLVHFYDGLQTPQRTYELLKNSDCVSGRKAK